MAVLCDCMKTTTLFLIVVVVRDQKTQFSLGSLCIGRLTVFQAQLSPECQFFCLVLLKDGLGIYSLPTLWQERGAVLYYHS